MVLSLQCSVCGYNLYERDLTLLVMAREQPFSKRNRCSGEVNDVTASLRRVLKTHEPGRALDKVWPIEQETRYLESLSSRETFHVAVNENGRIVGFQSLDLWSTLLPSMAHNGQVGTFVLPEWRGHGIGRQLWSATEAFAREALYSKLAIQVRASNASAQEFYRALGFTKCGLLTRQVIIDGVEDDEVPMEFFC